MMALEFGDNRPARGKSRWPAGTYGETKLSSILSLLFHCTKSKPAHAEEVYGMSLVQD